MRALYSLGVFVAVCLFSYFQSKNFFQEPLDHDEGAVSTTKGFSSSDYEAFLCVPASHPDAAKIHGGKSVWVEKTGKIAVFVPTKPTTKAATTTQPTTPSPRVDNGTCPPCRRVDRNEEVIFPGIKWTAVEGSKYWTQENGVRGELTLRSVCGMGYHNSRYITDIAGEKWVYDWSAYKECPVPLKVINVTDPIQLAYICETYADVHDKHDNFHFTVMMNFIV